LAKDLNETLPVIFKLEDTAAGITKDSGSLIQSEVQKTEIFDEAKVVKTTENKKEQLYEQSKKPEITKKEDIEVEKKSIENFTEEHKIQCPTKSHGKINKYCFFLQILCEFRFER
jgi:hypothetical protein